MGLAIPGRRLAVCWFITLLAAGVALAGEVHVAGASRPAVLEQLDIGDDLLALTVSADGQRAALAIPDAERDRTSLVQLHAVAGETSEVSVAGIVRSLLFLPGNDGVLALVHRPAKRRPGQTQLVQIDVDTGKLRRLRLVPPTSAALELWPARDSLLISTRHELRTVLLDGMRSGPLFRIPGDNLAVACLAGSEVVLVGQEQELLLIHLGDPPETDRMPVRERVTVPAPVVGLAASAAGNSALARLADGRLLRVRFGPLRVDEAGRATAVVTTSRGTAREPVPLAPLPVTEPEASGPPSAPTPEPTARSGARDGGKPRRARPTPQPEAPRDEPAGRPAPELEPPAPSDPPQPVPPMRNTAPPRPQRAPEPDAPSPSTPSTARPAPVPAGSPAAAAPGLSGQLEGPAVASVEAVVLLGPANMLREARRVPPAQDGSWSAGDLEPGRYRVQLDAGGNRVVVADPAFVVLEVTADAVIEAPVIRVLRVYRP